MKHLILMFFIVMTINSVIAQPIEIRITEVPYEKPYIFTRVSFEMGGTQMVEVAPDNNQMRSRSQIGFGFGSISAKDSDIQGEFRLGYRSVNLSNIDSIGVTRHQDFDILLGGRYYPRYPTFGLGKTPVRLTFAAIGGINLRGAGMGDQMAFDVLINAGLSFSQSDNASGVMLEFQYRPIGSDAIGGIYLLPSYTFCLAWLFAPN